MFALRNKKESMTVCVFMYIEASMGFDQFLKYQTLSCWAFATNALQPYSEHKEWDMGTKNMCVETVSLGLISSYAGTNTRHLLIHDSIF